MTPPSDDRPRSDAVVLFGATGDLAHRKLYPALYGIAKRDLDEGRDVLPVVGVSGSDWSDDDLRERFRDSLAEFGPDDVDDDVVAAVEKGMRYVGGDYKADDTFDRLADQLDGVEHALFFLAIPPSLFDDVVRALGDRGLQRGGRVLVEKPFGRDLGSAEALNATLLEVFDEENVFRIDHFLGKDEVLDLLVLRFANTLFDPAWNRHHVASVQITMAEEFDIGDRGRLYEETGALRDVVQNHLLQVLSLVAMEPPSSERATALRDEKAKVLKAIRPIDPSEVVRGQYDGYLEAPYVAEDSDTETFVALTFWIDSWRWAGVPFHVRAGKALAATVTEVLVEFKEPPLGFFRRSDAPAPHPNTFRLRMKPGERVSLTVQVKAPGNDLVSHDVDLAYDYDENTDGRRDSAYQRLLEDAVLGDQRLFARRDSVEESWAIIQPVLDDPCPVEPYAKGTWGPASADDIVTDHDDGWHTPDLPG